MFSAKLAIFLTLWGAGWALYIDQVGKWDWLQKHIGSVKLVNFGLLPAGA